MQLGTRLPPGDSEDNPILLCGCHDYVHEEEHEEVDVKPFPLFNLPSEIRVIIYRYMHTWPTFTKIPHSRGCPAVKHRMVIKDRIPNCRDRPMWPPYRANLNNVLIANRRLSQEIMYELLKTPLVFDRPPPFVLQKETDGVKESILSEYLEPSLLGRVRFMHLNVQTTLKPEDESNETDPSTLWEAWAMYVKFMWQIFHVNPPALEGLTITLGGAPGVWGVGLSLDFDSYPTRPGLHHARETIIYYLSGLVRMLKKECNLRVIIPNRFVEDHIRDQINQGMSRNPPRYPHLFEQIESNLKTPPVGCPITPGR